MKWFARFRLRGMKRRINRLSRKINRAPIAKQDLDNHYIYLREIYTRKVQYMNQFTRKHGLKS